MTGVIARTDRAVLRMFGRDPLKMIQGLATNDIAGAAIGQSVYTAFLTPKGKMVGDARVLRREDGDIWIEADRAAAENIAANLKKFVPPLFAKFETMSGKVVIEFVGDDVRDVLTDVPHDAVLANPFRADSRCVIVTAEDVDAAIAAAVERGAVRLADDELEVMRIEAGEPRWGYELTEEVIPLEAGLRHVAISETKGCYTGQEVIIRILHRGHVNRLLRGIMTGTSEVPATGAELLRMDDGKVVGQVTSACYSPALAQAIALAYVRREVTAPAVLQLAGNDVHVSELPFASAAHGVEK